MKKITKVLCGLVFYITLISPAIAQTVQTRFGGSFTPKATRSKSGFFHYNYCELL
jgi:hypothetical protein